MSTTAQDIIIGALSLAERKREYQRAWCAANRDKVRKSRRAYESANKEKVRAWDAARRVRDREKIAEQRRARYAANPQKYRNQGRVWRENNLDKAREHSRNATRRKNKLPTPTRPVPSNCECCGSAPGKKSLAVDHCHDTGRFRGWLCTNCNTGIGKLGDGIDGLIKALEYLKRHGGIQ